MYLNKAFIYGNLTRDPELRALPSGGQVASFGVATNRTYKDKNGQKQEATEFHNIVAFGRTAEIIGQYFKKGRPIFVEGRIQTRTWDDKETGKKNYRTEIVIENFQFGADAKGGGSSQGSGSSTRGEAPPTEGGSASGGKDDEAIKYPDEEINPEDIPF
ncbi:single-stranded DNA-binding protein [Candidatus Kaiserbacteria bacterium]|nr:single-stranded DNA-binding protein [Candidatus Kaiserbacteria bacterium]